MSMSHTKETGCAACLGVAVGFHITLHDSQCYVSELHQCYIRPKVTCRETSRMQADGCKLDAGLGYKSVCIMTDSVYF